ncbi:MAG TPA: fumarylacetoacetase [Clostridiales bacterium]|nr:fumarylacetoacetase [Clostridiales bacterium]HBK03637.1 fumarylacetoacetase [Clostridiales bacterium]HCI64151.1 fumarylacetoacetase [Clostridiales bacterium]
MKLLTCIYQGRETVAVLTGDEKQVVPLSAIGYRFTDMNDLIRRTDRAALAAIFSAAEKAQPIPLEDVRLTAPIPHPVRDVVCMGLNYKAHADEMADALKERRTERVWPIFFGKAVDRCRGDGETIPSHSDFISTLDYECELGVILGKDAYQVPREQVADYIFGYTVLNDVTARELSRHKQNYFMKSLDGTCPLGPWIVTAEEIAYPPRLDIRLWVNGEPRQHGNTGDMIFDITDIVSELSRGVTLPAGTIIATGSPTGIGFGMNPPVFLKDADVVTCQIEKIGVLTNTVRDEG